MNPCSRSEIDLNTCVVICDKQSLQANFHATKNVVAAPPKSAFVTDIK